MVLGLLVPVLVVAIVALAVRHARGTDGGTGPDGHAIRRVFQYLLLYGLVVVVAIGVAGLLGRLLEGAALARADQALLARDLAFAVVGVPLATGTALWSRRTLTRDPGEAASLAWAAYVTAAALTCMAMAATGAMSVLGWALGLQAYSGLAAAQVLVWGGLWAAHRRIDARVTPPGPARVHRLAGSLIGLATAATGLGALLAGALRFLWGLDAGTLFTSGGSPVLRGLVTLAVGAAVWWVHWLRGAARDGGEPLWHAYVLLAGVAGGVVAAIVGASALAYSGLVWVFGEPAAGAAEHFSAAPAEQATVVVGVLVWWYHQAVLRGAGAGTRTEVTRVYEYLMAGIGLLAAAAGLTTLVAAAVEGLAGAAFAGGSTVHTLLAGLTLVAVGGPVWWLYWRRIGAATAGATPAELRSPTRRVYLSVLFGLSAVAAVVALVVAVYLLFSDVVHGTVTVETYRRMRYAIGVLLCTPVIAGYHWSVRRDGLRRLPAPDPGGRFVLLVGPADRATAREVARRTHSRVEAWSRPDEDGPAWTADAVTAALAAHPDGDVVVLSDAGGIRVVPVQRRPAAAVPSARP